MNDVVRDLEQIRNYLHGRLSEEEELLFQDRLAREPSLVRELEQSLRIREGLRQLRAHGYPPTPAPRHADAQPGGLLRWLLPAVAAGILATVCINIWWDQASVLIASARVTAGAPRPPITQFSFVSMRDAAYPRLTLPASGLIEFRAAPETLRATSYRMTLIRRQERLEQRIGSLGGLTLQEDGYIHGFAESARLTPGSYSLRIESDGEGTGEPLEYLFLLQPGNASAPR